MSLTKGSARDILIEVILSKREGHCQSHDLEQGGHALGCVWTALCLVMSKPSLTQATLKQEDLSKHLSFSVHPVAQVT